TKVDADKVTIKVKDAQGNTFNVDVKVDIKDAVPTISVTEDATGAYGSEITGKVAVDFGADGEDSITVKINDGTEVPGAKDTDGNYTFTMDDGKTVVLNGATGEFTYNGVPASGTEAYYTFEFTVTDSDGDTATATTTATVAAKLPLIKIYGNDVSEEQSGTSTGNKVVGTITAEITNGVIPSKDIVIDLGNGKIITIPAGSTTGIASTEVDTTRVDDYYDQGETTENFEGTIISGNALFVDGTTISTATVTINDDKDPTGVTLNATIIKTSTITKDNLENNLSFKVTAEDGEGNSATISKNDNVEHSGFGVLSSNETDNGKVDQNYSGDPKELGIDSQGRSEKIIIEFNNEVKSMDVSFAWRATQEEARVDFYDGDTHVGYAIVSGGGNGTEATVIYYKPNGDVLKTVNAPGGTDKVDLSYTFEPGDGTVFNKVEFTAVDNGKVTGLQSDYLIHSITYQEVVQGNSLDKGEKAEVLLEVQTEYKPDPKTFDPANPPIAKVDVNGTIHDVKLDENGYGTLELTTDGNTDLVAKVTEIIGGNYEAVDVSGAETGVYVGDITTKGNEDNTITAGPDGNATAGNDIIIGDKGGVQSQFTAGKNYNIALIVDTSGSMKNPSGTAGKTRMALTIDALENFVNSIKGHDGIVNVTLFGFNKDASTPVTINGLTSANAGNLITKIKALSATGGTNYEAAFEKAITWFKGNPNSGQEGEFENLTYFLTDGNPTYYYSSETTYGGNGSDTTQTVIDESINAFEPLKNISKVHAIGIGNDISVHILQNFDNTAGDGFTSIMLDDFSTSNGWGKITSWEKPSNDGSLTINNSDQNLRIKDTTNSDDKAYIVKSDKFTIDSKGKTELMFDYRTHNTGSDTQYKWKLEKLVNGDWVENVPYNTLTRTAEINNIKTGILNEGTYRLVFSVNSNSKFSELAIDNIQLIQNSFNENSVHIVNTAEDLAATLQGGSTTYDPAKLGNDIIDGGAGNDIIFGDTINTDNLQWKGSGTLALEKYLELVKGVSPAGMKQAMYDYIKENHASLGGDGTKDGNDTITGGEGRDIIYAQGGDDTIITDINTNNGKADGDILIDGGTGFDTIKLEGNNDIDFSKLGDIIKNIEAIDLTEGNHKLTNITLDDVLKMSGDDNKIKITGDEFDSVSFKKNNGWVKANSTVTEKIGEDTKTFEIYTNSGDPTVQVKVEEKISDGITS
ncbi:VWA domain-containing protein, partial [Aliarcobacter cryaerophilus]|uniref:vWA domain-containing protein n=1 Tax=Aliarcobacter cryaerophilus TaxID=28198 RepID=UPI003DA49079